MTTNLKQPFFWIVLIAAAAIAYLYVPIGEMIYQYGTLKKDLGWKIETVSGNYLVREVDPNGYASGKLYNGDRILAVNGNPIILGPGIGKLPLLIVGKSYNLTVLRHGEKLDVKLQSKIEHNSQNLISILTPIVSSLVFFVVALIIGLAKPDQRFTRLFTFTWFSVALIYMAIALFPMQYFFSKSELHLFILLWILAFCPLNFVTAYHFCYRFPPGVPESRFWSFLGRLLYIV